MKKISLLFTAMLVTLIATQAQVITEINKTLPLPDTILAYENYGYSVAVDGNYAVIASMGYNNSTGRATVLYNNGIGWEKVAILTASDGDEEDYFGKSVSISNNTIVVGAYKDDDKGSWSGSAYVFQKPATGWADMTETAKLTASDGVGGDYFGTSVSISGNTIVVGAYGDDDNGNESGSAYIFQKPVAGWTTMNQTAKLTASDGVKSDYLGISVSIFNNTIVVGAHKDDNKGSAYVFQKPAAGWKTMTQTAKLTASDGTNSDLFGYSVSISDSTIVVGAFGDQVYGTNSGSAYVFREPAAGWTTMTQTAKLTASGYISYDYFGRSVSISDSTIVVGAYESSNSGTRSGSAFVFQKPITGWTDMTETTKFTESDGKIYDYFGCSVSISDSTIVVGAYQDDDMGSNSGSAYIFQKANTGWADATETKILPEKYYTGAYNYYGNSVSVDDDYAVIGAPYNNNYTGKAYVLHFNGTDWERVAVLTASDGDELDYFGWSVSISDSTIIIGAYGDDDNDLASGSAYIFQKPSSGWVDMTQTAKLTASDGTNSDNFGYSVSILDSTIVVGAYRDNSYKGSAYVFQKPTTGWVDMTQTAKLTASDGANSEYFGCSVSISDSTIIVGAYGDDDNGSVYIFRKPATGWVDMTQTAKLTASDGANDDYFGFSVSISDSTIAVGAYGDDDNGAKSGSAYVFQKPVAGWTDMTETAKLTASDGANDDYFGFSVSVSKNSIIVGAFKDDNKGSAYAFQKPAAGWADMTETAKLTASDGAIDDYFGFSVSISDSTILAGAYGDDDYGLHSGSAYFYNAIFPIQITEQPANQTNVCINSTTPFVVSGYDIDTYQWQISNDKEVTYSDISDSEIFSGSQNATLTVTNSTAVNNKYFRCIVANSEYIDTTASAVLTLDAIVPTVTCVGDVQKEFTTGSSYTVVGTELDATASDNCEVESITNDFNNASSLAGAILSEGKTTITWTVTDGAGNTSSYSFDVTVIKAVEVTDQPVGQTDVCSGSDVTYSVSGNNIGTYQWQMSNDNEATYTNIINSDSISGAQTATLSVNSRISVNNNYFRCVVSNSADSDTTNSATLTLETTAPTITCVGNIQKEITSGTTYTVVSTELDVTSSDNCEIESITNDFNNASSLVGAILPEGTTTIAWTVTDKAGNTSSCSSDVAVTKTNTGIGTEIQDVISLYPNPTTGLVNITLENNQAVELKIYSLTGEVVYYNSSFNGKTVDLSGLNNGIYTIKINTGGKIKISKLIKKR